MTVDTAQLTVFAVQHEIGEIVIEFAFIEHDDVHVPALVVRMTRCAFDSFGSRHTAMESAVRFKVRSDFRVAGNAEKMLRLV